MNDIYFVHSLDETTDFLNVFHKNFSNNFYIIEPNKESVKESIIFISKIPDNAIVVFLGHGHSTGLYTPQTKEFQKEIFINSTNGNLLFKNKKVILLSCNSNQFVRRLESFESIIGFGNIISSMSEVSIEAEQTGIYRKVDQKDIDNFNSSYCEAIILALKLAKNNSIKFEDIPKIVEFSINKKITSLLLNKTNENRTEITELYYEFRNEMIFKK
jgi:hypothetical protein